MDTFVPPPWAEAEVECLLRLEAIRLVVDAVLVGDWPLDAGIAEGLKLLLAQAVAWHERASALGLAA